MSTVSLNINKEYARQHVERRTEHGREGHVRRPRHRQVDSLRIVQHPHDPVSILGFVGDSQHRDACCVYVSVAPRVTDLTSMSCTPVSWTSASEVWLQRWILDRPPATRRESGLLSRSRGR